MQHADLAVQYLADLVSDKGKPDKERRLAAQELLDRAFGRSVDRSVHINLDDQKSAPASTLSLPEMRIKAAAILERVAGGDAVDGEYQELPERDITTGCGEV
ncbi:hypothetical protein EYC87_05275 [Halieaceae bacterium IMCC8485]|uniref:Uncharacterized protein n=1 Tax=Candidatus Seongchinamella marina TaxID=2518990 RepID=A0ABT3STL5_9GAMM|nr:hypothetical protein [Candidatus Seongchinamella marina]MCX2972995.1 hypothetical protein [Candidatus Seongchinamella marina]